MRSFNVVCASVGGAVFATVMACGASGSDDGSEAAGNGGDAGATVLDGSVPETSASTDAAFEAKAPEQCSADGWCATPLPDVDLYVDDVWPLSDRAFATAYSNGRGMKFLEWQDATKAWTYIDDGTQNAVRAQTINVWAPNKDEVYVAMVDAGFLFGEADGLGAFIYHGIRPALPGAKWSWTRDRVGCGNDRSTFTVPHVGGTSANDVYLTYCETIYRRHVESEGETDSGSASVSWQPQFVDDDPDSVLTLQGVTGTDPNATWFVGYRGDPPATCAVIFHKSPTGIERIADGTLQPDGSCAEKPGRLLFEGRLLSFHAPANDTLLGIRDGATVGNDIVRLARDGAGGYAVSTAHPPSKFSVNLRNIWAMSENDIWLVTTNGIDQTGAGRILRGTNVWSGESQYEYSSLIRDGVPNIKTLLQFRATSNSNLWAVGYDRAFHKSTP